MNCNLLIELVFCKFLCFVYNKIEWLTCLPRVLPVFSYVARSPLLELSELDSSGRERGGEGVRQLSDHSSLVSNNNNNIICPRLKIISQSELHKRKSTHLTDLELKLIKHARLPQLIRLAWDPVFSIFPHCGAWPQAKTGELFHSTDAL